MGKRETLDDEVRIIIDARPNTLVPWYLMTSYLYYHRGESVISDALFDEICERLKLALPGLTHPHKDLIDLEALDAGTGFHLAEHDYPDMVRGAAETVLLNLKRDVPLIPREDADDD